MQGQWNCPLEEVVMQIKFLRRSATANTRWDRPGQTVVAQIQTDQIYKFTDFWRQNTCEIIIQNIEKYRQRRYGEDFWRY